MLQFTLYFALCNETPYPMMVRVNALPPTHSFTPSLLHSFTPSLLYPFTPSPLHSFTHAFARPDANRILSLIALEALRRFFDSDTAQTKAYTIFTTHIYKVP